MTLYWIGYEWKTENESVAYGSTICGTKEENFSYENFDTITEQIKKEVFDEDAILSFLAEGPFITSVFRLDPESRLFKGEETSFAITFSANTKENESIRLQFCIKIKMQLENFNKTPQGLLIAFSHFLKLVRKMAENHVGTEFEEFVVYYIQELG